MGLIRATLGGASGKLAAYATPPDLQAYGAERGLTYLGSNGRVLGIHGVNTASESENVMYGLLPGGEVGGLCHVRQTTGTSSVGDSGSSRSTYAAYTRVGTRVPEAIGSLLRFELTNNAVNGYLRPTVDSFNVELAMRDLGFGGGAGWAMTTAPAADTALLQDLLSGPFGARLETIGGAFFLVYDQGSLYLGSSGGYASGPELDALCEQLCALAQALRQAALGRATQRPFEEELPEPAWLRTPAPKQPARKRFFGGTVHLGGGSAQFSDGLGGLGEPLREPHRSTVLQFAEASGAALEDALAFHQAFPSVPAPGRAYAVARAKLESGGTGRIVLLAGQKANESGTVAVICAVRPGTPSQPMPIGGDAAAMHVGVNDGLMAAWLYEQQGIDPTAIATLSQRAWEHAKDRGWVPA